ncbi:hypothetical protein, unknown function [Leishmania tarentolae]|uniref:Uncharacterized protein n=1 Tax=Leishmania tarentolae TaxID=5689 RepID=A0A640KDT8_LEITA|nr:hypothetical protein, unknown function [Leishmania tarentolae]
MTRERADARTGVSVVNSTTSGCATAGQPLYNVVAAAPTSSPRTATIAEVATPVRACTSSLLTGVAKYHSAYQRTQQLRSMKSGPLPSSQMFHFQPSMDTGSLSPQNDRGGEARGNTGTISGTGLLPVAGAGMTLPATAAAGPSEPRRHYHHSGTPLQRCSDGANAGLRNAGGAKGDYGPQRVPRLTRALLDELQRSYAAAADASSRPCDLPINLPLKEALVISWRDAVDHGAHSGNDCSGAPAMLRSPRLPSPARGHRVENVTAVLPSSEWTAAYSMQKPQSPPPQLHATPDAAPMNTRPDSPMVIRPDFTAPAPRERLCRQRYTSSPSPAPVAPPPVMLENHGAVLRAPHPQKLPLMVSPQKAQPRLHRRNLVERPAGKHTTHGSGDTPKSVPAVLQETTFESGEVLKTQPPLAPLEHQRTPVLTSVAIGLAAPPPAPRNPKGNTQGASTETVSVTEGCPMQRSSGQRIRNFFQFFRGRQAQPRRGRAWVAH